MTRPIVVAVWTLTVVALLLLPLHPARAQAAEPPLRVALIVGTNTANDPSLEPLHFADDDAARYDELFRQLGADTLVLSRFDANTARLHPAAATWAQPPERARFDQAVALLADKAHRAHEAGRTVEAYFLYAGHGRSADGRGQLALEDGWISGEELAAALSRIGADRSHVIIDACDSYLVAYSRGPGGERRPAAGFHDASALVKDPRVGLLLSTSGGERESHEWERFEAGVFSHEVRSGLYGAADADGDGLVSYRELAAFVERANAAIPNDRFRPHIHARAPEGSDTLLDLRSELAQHRLSSAAGHGAHYYIEDSRGVRLADFASAPAATTTLVRPSPGEPLYVRRARSDDEYTVAAQDNVAALEALTPVTVPVRGRGAEETAFSLLFSLPFDESVVESYAPPPEPRPVVDAPRAENARRRGFTPLTLTLGAVGGAALVTGGAFAIASVVERSGSSSTESQVATQQRNDRISTFRTTAVAAALAGGAALGAAIVLGVQPVTSAVSSVKMSVGVGAMGTGGGALVSGTF